MRPMVVIFDSEPGRAGTALAELHREGFTTIVLSRVDALQGVLRPDACLHPMDRDPDDRDALARALGPDVPIASDIAELQRVLVDRPLEPKPFTLGDVRIDLHQRRVFRNDRVESLSYIEVGVLWWLALHADQVVSRSDLLVHVWGLKPSTITRTVDNTISRVRKKVEANPSLPEHISTVRGRGYRLVRRSASAKARVHPLGRAAELMQLREAIDVHRVVTLVGPEGVGKTTLVRALCEEHPDAVLVDLTSARTPADLEAAVAVAAGLGRGRVQETIASVGPRLWVLDHVESLAPWLTEVLQSWLEVSPGLRVVLASCVVTDLPEQRIVRVPPLSVDDAVVLLRRVGQQRSPSFGTTADAERHLRALAQMLDGLPLALELAGSRARIVSARELRNRVEQNLDFVKSEAVAREASRSLEGALGWSFAQLTGDERRTLSALSVFRGGFDLQAVEAVAQDVDALERLVDQSLAHRSPGAGEVRFGLLNTVRRFVEARQTPAERAQWVRAHVRWFLEMATRWTRELTGPAGWDAARSIERERDNLFVAAQRAADDEPVVAVRLLLALAKLWSVDATPTPEVDLLAALARRVEDDVALACEVWFTLAGERFGAGDPAGSEAARSRCVELATASGVPDLMARAELLDGHIRERAGDLSGARACWRRGLQSATEASTEVGAHLALGRLAGMLDDPKQAERHIEIGLELARDGGLPWQVLDGHGWLGIVYLHTGCLDDALRETQAAAEGWRRWGSPLRSAWMMTNLGVIHYERTETAAAIELFERARAKLCAVGHPTELARLGVHLARARRASGDADGALAEARQAVRIHRQTRSPKGEVLALIEVTWALYGLRRFDQARVEIEGALQLARDLESPAVVLRARWVRGQVAEASGRPADASIDYREGLEEVGGISKGRRSVAQLCAGLASTELALGRVAEARQWLDRAREAPPPRTLEGRRALVAAMTALASSEPPQVGPIEPEPSRQFTLSDEHWAIIAPLLPPRPRRGRPRLDDRVILEGILWILHTKTPWRELPNRFGHWKTVYGRFSRWTRERVWDRLLQASNGPLRKSRLPPPSWLIHATNVWAARAASGGGSERSP